MNLRRQPSPKTSVELSLDQSLVADAASLGMDLAVAVEDALRRAVAAEKARRWQEENREAIRLSNEEIEKNGLWCDDYRLF